MRATEVFSRERGCQGSQHNQSYGLEKIALASAWVIGLEGRKRGLEKSIKKLYKDVQAERLGENIDTGARDKCLDKKDMGIQIQ